MSVQKMMNIGLNMDENTTGEDVEHNTKVSLHVDDVAVLCEVMFFIVILKHLIMISISPTPNQMTLFRALTLEDITSNDDVGVTVVDPDETMPEYEGFTIDEKELENAKGGGGIDFDKLELPSSPSVSTHASIRRNASLQNFLPFITCLICFRRFYTVCDNFVLVFVGCDKSLRKCTFHGLILSSFNLNGSIQPMTFSVDITAM
ncbi:unnamed protein product [Lactuca saligna]|uniref:Uncharacterized protein n=1 Tax=Lactuca saligna TaxID=75948 RepID=A0AA35YWL2_LACSI|nr:unnamed protein product [Lactuca saligna]